MIHELRRYTVKPGKLADYVEKSGSIGRPIRGDRYGKLLGYWSTELGPLNQVVHLWEFADLAARTTARAGLAKDERWVKEYLPVSGPLARGAGEHDPHARSTGRRSGRRRAWGIHELRVYRLHPGKAAAYSETMREALAHPGEALRPRWATGSSRSARSTRIVHLWGYRDLAHRAEVRRALAADATWQAAAGRPHAAPPVPGGDDPGPHELLALPVAMRDGPATDGDDDRPRTRADRRRVRLRGQRAPRDEHGAAAPLRPRRLPDDPHARGRDDRRRRPGDRLPPPLPREARGDPDLRPVPVDRLEDGLRLGDDRRALLRARGRAARPDRGAEARPVPPRPGGGAPARRLPLPLARHLVHGHGRGARRRGDDVPLLLPRARDDPRPLRGADGRAAPLRVPPDRRDALRHPRRVGGQVPGDDRPHRGAAPRVRGAPRGEHDLPGPHPGRGRDLPGARPGGRASRARSSGARASPTTSAAWSPTPRTRSSPSTCRSRPRATALARYRVRMQEFRQAIRIVRQALDGLPAGPISSRPGREVDRPGEAPEGRGVRAGREPAGRGRASTSSRTGRRSPTG